MKNLKEKIKKLIEAGEDPELVRKLEEVLAESEKESSSELVATDDDRSEEVVFTPAEIPLTEEALAPLRQLQAEKVNIERAIGQHYVNFERQIKPHIDAIDERILAAREEQKRIVEAHAPVGLASEYRLAIVGEDEEKKIVLQKMVPQEESN